VADLDMHIVLQDDGGRAVTVQAGTARGLDLLR
jgi:hypothetical protein